MKTMRIFAVILLLIILCVVTYNIFYGLNSKYVLPKRIWSYWHDTNIPADVQSTLDSRKQILNTYEHIVLHENTIGNYIHKPFPPNFQGLSHQHKADWVRLALLCEYGGCWMDTGIIINNKLAFDLLYSKAIQTNAELVAFYLESRIVQNRPDTFIENWCLIAPQGSPLICRWYDQYVYAVSVGFDNYKSQIEHRLENYSRFGVYLTQHICLQIVLQDLWMRPVIVLEKAEDSMYKLHKEYDWDSEYIMNSIRTDTTVPDRVPYIKLRGAERATGVDISPYFERIRKNYN